MRALLLLSVFAGLTAAAEPLPFSAFGHLPMVEEPEVSPNGEYVAAIINGEQGPTVNVAAFGSRELTPILQLRYGRDRIDWIEWASDERLLIAASESDIVSGDRIRVSRLFSIRRDGKGLEQIERKALGDIPWWTYIFDTTRVVHYLPDDPKHILLQLYDDRDEAFAVYRVDIEKNRFEKLFVNSYNVGSWHANLKGEVVLGVERDKDLLKFWHRPDPNADWQVIREVELFESETFDPILVDGNEAIVVSDHDLGRQALWRYDIAAGEFVELLFAAEGRDIEGAILSPDDDEVIGAIYYDDYRVDEYFDAKHAAEANLVKSSFPQYQTAIVSRSLDGKRMIVLASRDNSPDKYFWLDLGSKAGGIWFSQYPYLEQAPLAAVEPFDLQTEDGLTLRGYLTMPTATGDAKPPLVVMPHGGPQSRDYRYFDPYVQFLANRGYAVLQVNFRGSTGFGNALEVAGYRQWGTGMQNDVYAAIDWLAARDVVDMDRVCFVGGSYGGYVALTAAFQRPTAYRCHVALAPVSDLVAQAEASFRWDNYKAFVRRTMGDPTDAADKAMLEANSPIDHLRRIKTPILLVHGTYDTQVRVQQSRDFVKQAERAGIDIEYLELDTGTHYFDEYANRLLVFEAIERFLAEHL